MTSQPDYSSNDDPETPVSAARPVSAADDAHRRSCELGRSLLSFLRDLTSTIDPIVSVRLTVLSGGHEWVIAAPPTSAGPGEQPHTNPARTEPAPPDVPGAMHMSRNTFGRVHGARTTRHRPESDRNQDEPATHPFSSHLDDTATIGYAIGILTEHDYWHTTGEASHGLDGLAEKACRSLVATAQFIVDSTATGPRPA